MEVVQTNNIKNATKIATNTVRTCGMMVISGKPGIGKSTFRSLLVNKLEEDGHTIVYYIPFRKVGTQTNAILGAIYESLFPEQHIPANENKKMRDVRKVINPNNVPVVIMDNMQNLDLQTIREIKIIWEELKYISIMFFLKNDTKILNLLDKVEIGQRVNKYSFKDLTPAEVEKIAIEVHGLEFEDEITKTRFLTSSGKNPLTIKHLSELIKEQEDYTGKVTLQIISRLELETLNRLREEFGISIRDIEKRMEADGLKTSRGFIANTFSGKIELESETKTKGGATVKDITNTLRKMVSEKQQS